MTDIGNEDPKPIPDGGVWDWKDTTSSGTSKQTDQPTSTTIDIYLSPIEDKLTDVIYQGITHYNLFNDWLDYIIAALENDNRTQQDIINEHAKNTRSESQQASLAQFNSTDPQSVTRKKFDTASRELIRNSHEYGYDLLGEIHKRFELRDDSLGQCYTPRMIADFTVESNIDESTLEEMSRTDSQKPKLMGDPSCGSGCFLISLANRLREANTLPPILIMGQDIDPIAAKMAVINSAVFGIPGFIVVGDTLLEESNRAWRIGPVCPDPQPTLVSEIPAKTLPDGFSSIPNGTADFNAAAASETTKSSDPPQTIFNGFDYTEVVCDIQLFNTYFK